jgi:hypothetical protein
VHSTNTRHQLQRAEARDRTRMACQQLAEPGRGARRCSYSASPARPRRRGSGLSSLACTEAALLLLPVCLVSWLVH